MNEHRKDAPEERERRFAARIADAYAPPPDAARRADFNRRLWARLERSPSRARRLIPALGAAVLTAALAWRGLTTPVPAPVATAESAASAESWEYAFLDPASLAGKAETASEAAMLPDDYAAIESAFLGG